MPSQVTGCRRNALTSYLGAGGMPSEVTWVLEECLHCSRECRRNVFTVHVSAGGMPSLLTCVQEECRHCSRACRRNAFTVHVSAGGMLSLPTWMQEECLHCSRECRRNAFTVHVSAWGMPSLFTWVQEECIPRVAAQAGRWSGIPEVARSQLTQCSKACDLQPVLQCAIRGAQGVLPCVEWGARPVNWIYRLWRHCP